jgi:DNA invertase Pin-like site-specific DNA recombinase
MTRLRAVIWCAVSTKAQADEDKDSLPNQEREARVLCQREGWDVAEVLIVPGHSRRKIDIHEVAYEMQQKGITAYSRLIELWKMSGFDILVCWDGNRFGRSQTLHSHVIERTLDTGARIYVLTKGWVDESNKRMFIAMDGYASSSEIDKLIAAREMGLDKRVARGLPANHIPLSHMAVRDKSGKILRIEVDESKRRLFDDLAALLLEGVGWGDIERELYGRFGHINPATGRMYAIHTFYVRIMSPSWWGNASRHHRHKTGEWIFDAACPAPSRVVIHYGTHPPVWDGEEGERLKAELRRRFGIRGKTRPHHSHMFTGLLVCAGCGRKLIVRPTYRKTRVRIYWQCAMSWKQYDRLCSQGFLIRNDVIQGWVHDFLVRWLEDSNPDLVQSGPDQAKHIAGLEREIEQARKRLANLVEAQAGEDSYEIRRTYTDKIRAVGEQIDILKASLGSAQRMEESPDIVDERRRAYGELKAMGVDGFWALPPNKINQLLHRLLGRSRILVRDGNPVDVVARR